MTISEFLLYLYFIGSIIVFAVNINKFINNTNDTLFSWLKDFTWIEIIINVLFIFGFLLWLAFLAFGAILFYIHNFFDTIKEKLKNNFLFKKPFKSK
jgi:choline-glycine betaine transporter